MSEEHREIIVDESAPVAQVQTRRTFSIIWVVPIIALLIGGWLVFKAQSTKGPTITITFKNADGLVAGKTEIKYKDVTVGEVTSVDLSDDFSQVVVTAQLNRDAGTFLTEKTRFWIVRARIGAGEVSGLGTLFSGVYIGIDPSKEGEPQETFAGLESPPILTKGLPGGNFILRAKELDSLDLGSPIYYRGIKVGQVVAYHFDKDAEAILINIFVKAPFHEKVLQDTRFWSVSGVDLTIDANGLKVDTQSLVSIFTGGVAFGLPAGSLSQQIAKDGTVFSLFPNRESSTEEVYTVKRYYLMYFDQSIRGLAPGAPVEIMGVKVGEVVSTKLIFNEKIQKFLIPVLVSIEPERLSGMISGQGEVLEARHLKEKFRNEARNGERALLFQTDELVENGFRARLKTGNLLTGKLYIDLDYYSDAQPAKITREGNYPVFPTVSAPLERMEQRVDNILKKIEALPLAEIGQNFNDILQKIDTIPITEMGNNMNTALASLTQTLEELRGLSNGINKETMPQVSRVLSELETTINGINDAYGPDSTFNHNAKEVTDELALTLRSLRSLLEYLETDPAALIFGKRGEKK